MFKEYESGLDLYMDVKDFLHEKEVENSLMISLLTSGHTSEEYFYLAGYHDGVKLVLIKQGLHLILAANDDDHLQDLADYIKRSGLTYPGVIGPRPFVDVLVDHLDCSIRRLMSQRIYKLDALDDIRPALGYMRRAESSDLDDLVNWSVAFALEHEMKYDRDQIVKKRRKDIKDGVMFVWQNIEIVAMAALKRSVGRGVSIGMVYTPPLHRKKGYASNLVAEVSKLALESNDYCCLYTDLSNETSNSIYQKLGYYPVVDSVMYLI